MRSPLSKKHLSKRKEIEKRLIHFENVGKGNGTALFSELAFCILTPQSKARSCDAAIMELEKKGLLLGGNAKEVAAVLAKKTRFHNNKAGYLVEAREKFRQGDFAALRSATFSGSEMEARKFFVKNVKGIGMKEASHYLRNVGRGREIAILDRHILKNLKRHGVIVRVPESLTEKKYLEIEGTMAEFCRKRKIPMAHLDLLFWSEETGEIFK